MTKPENNAKTGEVPTAANEDLDVRSVLARGTLSLGASATLQRGLSYAGVLIAARIAGPRVLGTYSAGLATASFAAGVIGLSVGVIGARFAGEYPPGSLGNGRFIRRFTAFVCITAGATAVSMFVLAAPLASEVLGDPDLAPVLRIAALVAGGFVLWEGVNGLLVGLLRYRGALVVGFSSGLILLVGLLIAASRGANWMLLAQAAALIVPALATVTITVLKVRGDQRGVGPRLADFLHFGSVQAVASIAVAGASWGVVALLARHDATGRSIGLYTVGQQMNSLAILIPGFFLQLVIPLVTRQNQMGMETNTLLGVASFSSMLLSLGVGGGLLLVAPTFVDAYGPSYGAGSKSAVFLVAAAIIGASAGASTNALVAQNVKQAVIVMFAGALSLALVATFLIPESGATGAGVAWISGQLVSGTLVLFLSRKYDLGPREVVRGWMVTSGAACLAAGVGYLRAAGAPTWYMALQGAVLANALVLVWRVGSRGGFLPTLREITGVLVPGRRGHG